jgi:hypothetical protein
MHAYRIPHLGTARRSLCVRNAAALTDGTSAVNPFTPSKVAIFVEPSPFSHISGMKNRFESLIKTLREAGDEVMVVTPDPKPPREFCGAQVCCGSCRYACDSTAHWTVAQAELAVYAAMIYTCTVTLQQCYQSRQCVVVHQQRVKCLVTDGMHVIISSVCALEVP